MRTWFLSPSCIGPIQIHAGYLHGQSHRPRCAGDVQIEMQTQARVQHCSRCDSRLVCPDGQSARCFLVAWLLPHPTSHHLSHCTQEVCKLTHKPTDSRRPTSLSNWAVNCVPDAGPRRWKQRDGHVRRRSWKPTRAACVSRDVWLPELWTRFYELSQWSNLWA